MPMPRIILGKDEAAMNKAPPPIPVSNETFYLFLY